jgi:uncharacterized protein DUF6232
MCVPNTSPRHRPRPRPVTRVYYNHNGVLITGRYFAAGVKLQLADLSDLSRGRGPRHAGVSIGLSIAVFDGITITAVIATTQALIAFVIAPVLLLAPCLIALYCDARWPAEFHLLAVHHGNRMLLYRTTNAREFGQLTRALIRALEAIHSSRFTDPD